MRTLSVLFAGFFVIASATPSLTFAKGNCAADLEDAATPKKKQTPPTIKIDYAKPDKAWQTSVETVKSLKESVSGAEAFLHSLLTASIANEFAWINGDPGGAKTLLSRLVFRAQLINQAGSKLTFRLV